MPPSPPAAAGKPVYAVLVDEPASASTYTITVVGTDGRGMAKLQANKRNAPAGAIDLPYVSTSSTSLYYLNGDFEIDRLPAEPPTINQKAAELPFAAANEEAAFAVSPDNKQIAVSLLDFSASPVRVKLYVSPFPTLALKPIFESTTDYVWPVAWHAGLLVLAHAYGPTVDQALRAAPARDNPYWAISYHVVDPATANRVVLMGACTVSGPLSPAGSACIQGGAIDWQGNTTDWSTHDWGAISAAASISPDGTMIAAADPDHPGNLDFWRQDGTIATYVEGPGSQVWAGWLDNTHVFIPATSKSGPRILDLSLAGLPAVFVDPNFSGFYAARLPTDVA